MQGRFKTRERERIRQEKERHTTETDINNQIKLRKRIRQERERHTKKGGWFKTREGGSSVCVSRKREGM